jgi:hypothetical protein
MRQRKYKRVVARIENFELMARQAAARGAPQNNRISISHESKTRFRPVPLFKTIQSCSWKAGRLYVNADWRASKIII